MLWKSCCGVFEGGGVRGIGHVGAACAMQEAGYQFTDLAGSSAGAIAAALLAAGYSCDELKKEMESVLVDASQITADSYEEEESKKIKEKLEN